MFGDVYLPPSSFPQASVSLPGFPLLAAHCPHIIRGSSSFLQGEPTGSDAVSEAETAVDSGTMRRQGCRSIGLLTEHAQGQVGKAGELIGKCLEGQRERVGLVWERP